MNHWNEHYIYMGGIGVVPGGEIEHAGTYQCRRCAWITERVRRMLVVRICDRCGHTKYRKENVTIPATIKDPENIAVVTMCREYVKGCGVGNCPSGEVRRVDGGSFCYNSRGGAPERI